MGETGGCHASTLSYPEREDECNEGNVVRRLETCGGGRGRHSGVRHLLNIPESLKDQHPPQLRPIFPTYTESYMHAHSRINPPGAPMVFSALQETDRDLRLKPQTIGMYDPPTLRCAMHARRRLLPVPDAMNGWLEHRDCARYTFSPIKWIS